MKKKSYADMDPLEEIRAIKEETSRRFKTATAYGQYLREKYPNGMNPEKFVRPEDMDAYFARQDARAQPEKPAPHRVKRCKTASATKPRGRGKPAKRLVPA